MIASFVTSHGFGHLNRTAAVLNQVPASIPITIFCRSDLYDHWRERLHRPAAFVDHSCDAGAYNPPGDSQTTDGPETIARALAAASAAEARFDEDLERLRAVAPKVVLADAASLPLKYAERLKIPGYLLANFTWADIYRSHASRLGPEAIDLVRRLSVECRLAKAILRTEPALRMMRYGAPVVDVGMVMTEGRCRPKELRETFGIPESANLVYSYLGRYGQSNLGWDRVARLAESGWHFVGFHPAPVGPLPNLHVVDPVAWTGSDLAASCDVMMAKAGYGTVCEALGHRRPMIYCPRTGFAEHRALDRALQGSGVGVRTSPDRFQSMKVEALLRTALAKTPGPIHFPIDGAARVAGLLVEECRSGGSVRFFVPPGAAHPVEFSRSSH